jgi:Glycosyltransferase family 29 (sialyltransferase)
MKAWLARWAGARRRRRGQYDRRLLAAAHDRLTGSVAGLLAAALWRRDLGRPLPARWVATLRRDLGQLSAAARGRALGLLAEVAPSSLTGLPDAWLDAAADLPGVAEALGRPQPLADAAERAAFAEWVCAHLISEHCLVGNAASLAGRGLGPRIDRAGAVWRFNQWQGGAATAADVGSRCDVWVLSPALQDAPLPDGLRWAVVSGPDMRFQGRHWPLARRLQAAGVPVLTVPLAVWRQTVQALQAPPSAGVLMLAWLAQLAGGWRGMTALGIGDGLSATGGYHLARPGARPGSRHDWAAEAALVARWRAQGLG